MSAKQTVLDRALAYLAPQWALRRQRARAMAGVLLRHYEGASNGRRTSNWNRPASDAATALGPWAANLRQMARDLVRNNAHASSAMATIADQVVGWGIVAKPDRALGPRGAAAWKEWSETTACDADGRDNLYGLQKLVMRTVMESGEALIRRRIRTPEDGLPIPLQIQVLEPDYIDTARNEFPSAGRRVINGIEFDGIGRRRGYYLFPEHPGSDIGAAASRFVPAEGILHVYSRERAGQIRGASWFAPVMLKLRDYDEYDDAQLMKQKIAACLAVITTDVTGTAPPLGGVNDPVNPTWDLLSPGAILNAPVGQAVEVVQPPRVEGYKDYAEVTLRTIAAGLGVTYEDLTGDYTELPFSAARMSRLRQWARVEGWRWNMMVPQFCAPVWMWAMDLMQLMGMVRGETLPNATWTAPPLPMIDPANEGLAYQRNIRTGIQTLSEAIRERGYDPEEMLREAAADFKKLDQLELVFDSDPRKMTQAGQVQSRDPLEPVPEPAAPTQAPAAATDPAEDPEDDSEDDSEDQTARAIRLAGASACFREDIHDRTVCPGSHPMDGRNRWDAMGRGFTRPKSGRRKKGR